MGFIVSKLFPKEKEVKIIMIGGLIRAEQLGEDEHSILPEPGRGHPDGAK